MSRPNSLRLPDYDYTTPGMYFVTIVTQERRCIFGEIVGDEMRLSQAGAMVQSVWEEIPTQCPGVALDAMSVMPNHIHGVVVLTGNADPKGQPQGLPLHIPGPVPSSLPDVIRHFKTLTTNLYIDGVKRNGWPRFRGRLWRRNYYDHVVRGDEDLRRIREYIVNNPLQWAIDDENPGR